ncbi:MULTISPECIES: NADPH-dependent F420 reductase [Stutzerimonas stutzeri subgroup]|uniref:NADP oxidoreductase, coenzyme F420-dependent n=1 Tax=Stutzerimonas stutzeri NF13 TaxID=1212548 RepID=M2UJG9_STUST|nr:MULTISPECIES: NADPH-dependent F420 reductase [Stutzerimonas stutzeri subgroup]EMD98639.1 NADP oxidoreductase, coenzyme F420-dependent [Stutzerimonas stutzeri NF13]MCQ4291719.1 NADPH-dependent F420 reductase [Stutzerimonas stutzeri]WOF81100.1 NADPH-dependent F420 reductase [Pseudomonas sp. FeN3W]
MKARHRLTACLLGLTLALNAAWCAAQEQPLRIGIIGTGNIGSALARLWVKAGHSVMISSRHPDRLQPLADELGERARAGTVREAAAFAEVILLAVPYAATPQVGRDHAAGLEGKIVLDAGNPIPARDGPMAEEARELGVGLASQRFLPGARLVRAFNAISAYNLRSQAHRDGERLAIPLAGDDDEALHVASRLVSDAGFDPVIVGPLSSARRFDYDSGLSARMLSAAELREALGL